MNDLIHTRNSFEEFVRKICWTLPTTINLEREMYNTMNLYYKYTSIPKSSFYKVNILILPINTEEKYLKYSIHFAPICD